MSKRKASTHWKREYHCLCNLAMLHLPLTAYMIKEWLAHMSVLTARRCCTGMCLLSSRYISTHKSTQQTI